MKPLAVSSPWAGWAMPAGGGGSAAQPPSSPSLTPRSSPTLREAAAFRIACWRLRCRDGLHHFEATSSDRFCCIITTGGGPSRAVTTTLPFRINVSASTSYDLQQTGHTTLVDLHTRPPASDNRTLFRYNAFIASPATGSPPTGSPQPTFRRPFTALSRLADGR